MEYYQLKLTGQYACFVDKCEMRSTTIFTTQEAAEKKIPKMIDMACDESNPFSCNRETAKVEIITLHVFEGDQNGQ